MKKQSRKRYFSLIFVPDQELNPKSITFSYATLRLLLVVVVVLVVHFVFGGMGYYRILRLERRRGALEEENKELRAQNKKIERIIEEFQEVRLTSERIRQAFGEPLGITGRRGSLMERVGSQTVGGGGSNEQWSSLQSPMGLDSERIQNSLYFLKTQNGGYLNPEHLPTHLPVEGFLTTHFQRGGWYTGRSHYGIDIAAKEGSVIRAAGAGVVLLSDWTPDFGNIIVISHGDGFFTYYAHAMRLLVNQGFRVSRGQPIALLGSSGISSAPHLHFEIWKDGEPLDPEAFIFVLRQKKTDEGS